ncbi:MAG: OsmC family peroxiredoxin [Acidobacteria bacterium]|nr:MAG: OsmC family peroxiredoxin [Acidobacteriota bacterium]
MPVTIDIEYTGDLHCVATHGPSGSQFTTDAPVDNGGKGEVFSPTDLVATGLGACLTTVMGLCANRTGLDITGTKVRVVKEMSADVPRRIAALTAVVTFPRDYAPADRQRLERTAHTCPVRQSLHPDVKVEIAFEYLGKAEA